MSDSASVVFIAFEERENLGVRYMASLLLRSGYDVEIIDFRQTREEVLETVTRLQPLVVGFSIIFEKSIYKFRDLIGFLRRKNISCHFTAGGHFASLQPGELFRIIPSLDSIVRFEGEYTMLDLVSHLDQGRDCMDIAGISHMYKGKLAFNRLRPLEKDLDQFPYPLRSGLKEYLLDKKYTTLLAGRGCIYNCAFCDTREFYRHPPGPVKRVRNPVKLVEEMALLHKAKGCSLFLFEDDDFPVSPRHHPGWIEKFCASLQRQELSGKIMWNLNCRPDEVDEDRFALMKQHGLFRVFLGIEDGTERGLQDLNKGLHLAENLRGIHIIKTLGLGLDYGFMLFQPGTTFASLRKNLEFLELICSDGHMPVSFLKMMPFLETRIKKELEATGRLKGMPGFLDYDFLQASMNEFCSFTFDAFNDWLHARDGLVNVCRWAGIYLSVFSFYHGRINQIQELEEQLKRLCSEANLYLLRTLNTLSFQFELKPDLPDHEVQELRTSICNKHQKYKTAVGQIINKVKMYYLTRGILIH